MYLYLCVNWLSGDGVWMQLDGIHEQPQSWTSKGTVLKHGTNAIVIGYNAIANNAAHIVQARVELIVG